MNRVLADTGPLVALLDADDADHARCVEAARQLHGELVTTWPVITEAFYLLAPDRRAQDRLLGKVGSGDLVLEMLGPEDIPGIRALLEKYADLPTDLADATLVYLAERDALDTVFTLDRDFRVYRLRRGKALKVVPPMP
jgi:predicted nucleic acid-binding protein